ncbi:MAG TPA: hypothetical protein VM431_03320 [Phycisphaerae bacterium]|nr:hypothetical protein [Phycisphaerae bacterium]
MRVLPILLVAVTAVAGVAVAQEKPPDATPVPGGFVRQVKVIADQAPDCSPLRSIIETITRGCKTNDQKAVAIYNFMRLAHYHHAYPNEAGGISAHKLINVYGWSLCGGLHTVEAALWREAGWPWRYVGWSGHTTVEAQYDGRWHYLDTFLKFYLWIPDANAPGGRTIAAQSDIKANPALITDGLVLDDARKVWYHKDNRFEVVDGKANWTAPAFLICGDEPPGIISGVRSGKNAGNPTGWAAIIFDDPGYSTDVDLAPGSRLTLTWQAVEGAHWFSGKDKPPHHSCGDKDYRNSPDIGPILEPYAAGGGKTRTFASGTLLIEPHLADASLLGSFAAVENARQDGGRLVPAQAGKPASVTLLVASPYVMTKATGAARGAEKAEVSVDDGKTFAPVDLKDFSQAVRGTYRCLVRLTFASALESLRLEVTVQHNRCALPYLAPGKNKVTVSVADPKALGDAKLAVAYVYCLGSRSKSYEDLCDAGAEVARAHHATWDDRPIAVVKTFAAKDLPATFEIDVPTPKDKYPVYPRMVSLTRVVLPAGAAPFAIPENVAAKPKVRPGDELKTLPDPFLIGTTVPPARAARPTAKRSIPLRAGHVVSMKGEVFPSHFLKWLKDSSDAWVLLIGGDLKDLPPARDIASANLVLTVVRGHEQAPTKVAAVALSAPFEAGKPYDFKNLGDVLGTAVVPPTPQGQDFSPPREFRLDVTRAVKQVAGGKTFHGFAVRTVPDRGVDEGWTVRIDVPRDLVPRLELDVSTGP